MAALRNKNKGKSVGPQEVAMSYSDDQLKKMQETILHSSVFRVGSELTRICHPSGGTPDEVVATFTRVYELLEVWYKGTPLKMQIKEMLDKLYPEPPGYEPGETLTPRSERLPDTGFDPVWKNP